MEVISFLQCFGRLPEIRKDRVFPEHLKNIFGTYLCQAKKCKELDNDREKIKQLADKIVATVEAYEMGNHARAFGFFEKAMEAASGYLEEFKSISDINKSLYLYRMRTAPGSLSLLRNELFHIPLNKRHFVSKQRYSLSGLPCLYLGNTSYVCWEELGRPDFNQIWVSCFRPTRKMNLLCLGYPIDAYTSLAGRQPSTGTNVLDLELKDGYLKNYACLWPLIAACSHKVLYKSFPYKPEYLIPQMLLQWIVNNEKEANGISEEDRIDGICYPSNNISSTNIRFGLNFVFPVKHQSVLEEKYCGSLLHLFEMTEPEHWPFLRGTFGQEFELGCGKEDERCGDFYTSNGRPMIHYRDTEFGKIDVFLQNVGCSGWQQAKE